MNIWCRRRRSHGLHRRPRPRSGTPASPIRRPMGDFLHQRIRGVPAAFLERSRAAIFFPRQRRMVEIRVALSPAPVFRRGPQGLVVMDQTVTLELAPASFALSHAMPWCSVCCVICGILPFRLPQPSLLRQSATTRNAGACSLPCCSLPCHVPRVPGGSVMAGQPPSDATPSALTPCVFSQ